MKEIRKIIYSQQETVVNTAIFIIIFLFLLSYFKPSLILLDTVTSGGDTGSHNYPLWYLKNALLPKGRLSGWSPGWYAGFPIFQFYFVLPFLLMTVLSYFLPLWVSFKIVTALGTFLLPIAAFAAMKLMRFKFPAPILAAIFTLPFLFMEANSMWGGNIPSTLAGEFSYSLSLAFTILFFGSLYKGIESKKLLIFNSVLFALIILTHVYTMLFVLSVSCFFLIEKNKEKLFGNFSYLFRMYLLSFLLTAFWLLPLVLKLGYTTPYNHVWKIRSIKEVFPEILLPFYLLFFVGAYKSIKLKDRRFYFILFSLISALLLYFSASKLGIVDIRFIPFVQFFPLLVAAYIVSEAVEKIKLSRFKLGMLAVFLILGIILLWVSKNVSYIDFWIEWNYSGFENKNLWEQYSAINKFLAGSTNDPRVVYEHSMLHDAAGTPRAFESLPLFSGRSTLEGLYMQSTITAPFVFYIQSEISSVTSCPFPDYSCTTFNSTKAAKHLEMFNVKHVIARTDNVKSALDEDPRYELVKNIDPYKIYELKLNNPDYVVVPTYQPVLFKTDNWKSTSYEWFKRYDIVDVPLIFSNDKFELVSDNLDNLPMLPIDSDCLIEENVKNEEIEIKTSCVGKPHIIRISYFPNWRVEGADKIYLVSPSFMLVYPKQEYVRLYYGKLPIDQISEFVSYVTALIIFFAIFSRNQKIRRFFNL